MSKPTWFKQRGYLHFDVPVKPTYAEALNPEIVTAHKWSPLIRYIKKERRYKPLLKKTVIKPRPIMYASHRDSCILSKYSADLVEKLEQWYSARGLDETVVAYRPLGRSNYHFAKRVQDFVRSDAAVTVICFDVEGFFDNLNHNILKDRLKLLLNCTELPGDWFSVFKFVTRYHFVTLNDLQAHDVLAKKLRDRKPHPLATVREIKALGISISGNPAGVGIPQGTPISASFSNLYMTTLDLELAAEASARGAFYQRYSDDIVLACPPSEASALEQIVEAKLQSLGLRLQRDKTVRVKLAGLSTVSFQYLGYELGHMDARLRHKSLSRQWRTARRALKKTERIGKEAISTGKSKQIYTRKLHVRFTVKGARNFLSYVDRSADTLQSQSIRNQAKRLRRFVKGELARLKGQQTPPP